MMTGMPSAQMPARAARRTPRLDFRGAAVRVARRLRPVQVIHSAAPMSSPGTMPARNSLEIDTLADTPKMISPMLGGITGAMMPAEAISPADRFLSYPAAVIMGSSRAVMAAASATADPE